MTFSKPKGTTDIYGKEAYLWQRVESEIRSLCGLFCMEEIRTPVFEHTELFSRGVGETTDIVQKEMFEFKDAGNRSLTLKPEGTAGAVRAFIENSMYAGAQPTKLFYIAPTFRAERPQKGRQRQFHQFGVEIFGSYAAAADAEMVSVAYELLRRLGIKNTELRINSLGCTDCRKKYNETLKRYIGSNLEKLCPTCRERFEKNPLRVLDCKSEGCKAIIGNAPSVLNSLDGECTKHFEDFKGFLKSMKIPYIVDEKIVRGLDYYTRTVFEIVSTNLGAQSTVCGGGRYDNLVESLGGPKTGATGFGLGIERLLIILEGQGLLPEVEPSVDIFIGAMGDEALKTATGLVYKLRQKSVSAESDTVGRSVKAQFKYADKIGAKFSAMIGETEMQTNKVKIKNMLTGEQKEVDIDVDIIKGELLKWENQ